MVEKGKKLNLKMDLILLNKVPLLELVIQNIVMSYQTILLFPDSLPLNDYALRFILTRCYEKRVLTFALDYRLVERGVFCGVYLEYEKIVSMVVNKIKELNYRSENDNNNSNTKIEYSTLLNRNVSKYLGLEPNCNFTSFID